MSSSLQQGDIFLRNDPQAEKPASTATAFRGQEFGILILNGTIEMVQDFDTAAKLSLFGGNILDDGTPGSPETWWGNRLENQDQFKLVSRTQHLLRSLPATSSNLRRVEEAARADLNWFLTTNIASSIEVRATIPQLNRVGISGAILAQGLESRFAFVENWKASV